MGLVQQAVLDFDEEIQVPWRPRLVAVAGGGDAAPEEAWPHRPRPSGRSSSRVGVCRPVEQRAPAPERRAPGRRVPERHGTEAVQARPGEQCRRSVEPARPRRSSRRRVRLTRRARLLAAVLALALGVAVGSWLGPLLGGGSGDLRLAGVQSVVVQPGDTLWSISSGVAGTADIRAVVHRIQEMNGLQGTVLVPGQVLELP
jgi:nucleoid-associated protein YgaU